MPCPATRFCGGYLLEILLCSKWRVCMEQFKRTDMNVNNGALYVYMYPGESFAFRRVDA